MTGSRISFALWRCIAFLLFLSFPARTLAEITYVKAYDAQGRAISVPDNRRPALYTKDFGDCQGDSVINVTRFDGAYYKDNSSVVIDLVGSTSVKEDIVMLDVEVYAYGESRFSLTFNPCSANMLSLCPLNGSNPLEINLMIPVGAAETANIPTIAYSIPDFEGQAIARIFSNSTKSQIACFSAVLTNGKSFSQPTAVASTLGAFTVIALFASLVAAMYGADIASTRSHYAHSLSMFVVFSVFHHIYFTGALSMNWPSVLVAFWSNYAWSAGMIYSEKMQNSINQFIGSNRGNISMVGAAAAGTSVDNVGGGYDISLLYKRNWVDVDGTGAAATGIASGIRQVGKMLAKRSSNSTVTNRASWYGSPVLPGLPLPGNYSGFAGTLGPENIPASNAFMTGLLWFLVLLAFVPVLVACLKLMVEGMSLIRMLDRDKFAYFRTHWMRFAVFAMLRTIFVAFFMMMFLTLFQFVFGGPAGVLAVAAVVFVIFLVGMLGGSGWALYSRMRGGRFVSEPDRLLIRGERIGFSIWRASRVQDKEAFTHVIGSLPWWRMSYEVDEKLASIHHDEEYLKKFGWLYARFRRTRWFTFAIWLVYEFVRACFFGAAAGHPMTQVWGLLAVEAIALIAIVCMRPFEATRLNALMVYFLGFSKVATVALSSAFDPRFGLSRIMTTVIGIVIIVIQGVLTIFLLIAIVVGAASTYMSITRDRDVETFHPKSWRGMRTMYLAHIDKSARDLPPAPRPPTPPPPPTPEEPKGPSFNIVQVQRYPKIEDEDEDNKFYHISPSPIPSDPSSSSLSSDSHHAHDSDSPASIPHPPIINRSSSVQSRRSYSNLPFGARPVRASWNSRDFERWREEHHVHPEGEDGDESSDDGRRARSSLSRDSSTERARHSRNLKRASSSLSRSESPAADVALGDGGLSSNPNRMSAASLAGFLKSRSIMLDDVDEEGEKKVDEPLK